MASLEQVTPIPAERDSAPDDRPRTFRRSNWATVFLAGVHALAVVTFPWELVSRSGFSDFDTYVQTFTLLAPLYPISAVDWYEISTLLGLYTHEVLWFDGVMWLTSWSGDPVVALRLVSFAIVFVWGLYLFRSIPYLPAVLFLLNPASIDVALSGLRNGAAWGLIMCGLMVGVWVIRLPLFVISIFTHSTALPLLGFHYLANALGRRREGGRALVVMLSAGVVVGLALTVGNAWLLGAIGDRRIGESYVVGEGSLLQASLFAILLVLQCTSDRSYVRRHLLVIGLIAWYLVMNPFIPWSYRLWAAFLPVIAVAAWNLSPRRRRLFLICYGGYLTIQYFYWSKLFYLWYPQ